MQPLTTTLRVPVEEAISSIQALTIQLRFVGPMLRLIRATSMVFVFHFGNVALNTACDKFKQAQSDF